MNVTITVHEPAAAIGAVLQLSVSVKSPLGVTAETVSEAVPVLVTTTLDIGLAVLITCGVVNVSVVAGDSPTAGAGVTPVPDNDTVMGVFPAAVAPLDPMERVPVRVPDAVGEKVTLSAHPGPLSASGVVQLVGATLKSPEAEAVTLVMPPDPKSAVFDVTVTVCAAEVCPTRVDANAVKLEGL